MWTHCGLLDLMHKGKAGWGVNGLSDSVRAVKRKASTLHSMVFIAHVADIYHFPGRSVNDWRCLNMQRMNNDLSFYLVGVKVGVWVTVSLMAWICWDTPQNQMQACYLMKKGEKRLLKELRAVSHYLACVNIQDAFLSAGREGGARDCVGDWINYVLSPFSWLKSTLLPLDSLCLCLRPPSQMDPACHPMQTLPSLLSDLHSDTRSSDAELSRLCLFVFLFIFFVAHHSSFSVICLHQKKKKRKK